MTLLVSVSAHAQQADTIPHHDANKALLLSLFPGAGQVYNGQAWKLPIVYGIIGGVGYVMVDNYNKMRSFKEDYLSRVNGEGPLLEQYAGYPDVSVYNLYQEHNKSFQLFVMLTAAAYALNLIDAYVFGHLYDFQIDDNLTLRFQPSLTPNICSVSGLTPSLGVRLNF